MNTTEKWEFSGINGVSGSKEVLIFTGARKNRRGAWLTKRNLPDYVAEYLCLVDDNGTALFDGFSSNSDLMKTVMGNDAIRWLKTPHYDRLLAVARIDVPAKELNRRKSALRAKRLANNKSAIKNIVDLAEYIGINTNCDESMCEGSISRCLFKYTNCGIGFHYDRETNSVSVSGYCEGTDVECTPITLTFPFLPKEWDNAVTDADREGCELWDNTHGCDDCYEGGEFGDRPVNPECKTCGGHGVIV
jgi:hypothetical protein